MQAQDPIEPVEEPETPFEIDTFSSDAPQTDGSLSLADELWQECEWLRYAYGRPGPWLVTVTRESAKFGTVTMTYTTNDEMADPGLGQETNRQMLQIKTRADFTDGSWAPTPPGDHFRMRICENIS